MEAILLSTTLLIYKYSRTYNGFMSICVCGALWFYSRLQCNAKYITWDSFCDSFRTRTSVYVRGPVSCYVSKHISPMSPHLKCVK